MSTANTDEHMRYELLAREMFLSDLATDLDAAEKKESLSALFFFSYLSDYVPDCVGFT